MAIQCLHRVYQLEQIDQEFNEFVSPFCHYIIETCFFEEDYEAMKYCHLLFEMKEQFRLQQVRQAMLASNKAPSMKGKMIKNYTMDDTLAMLGEYPLIVAHRSDNVEVMFYALDKNQINNETLIYYNNTVLQNKEGVYPAYIEVIQSASFIYIVFERIEYPAKFDSPKDLLSRLQQIFKNVETKVQANELFVNRNGKLCYLPAYQKSNMSSKFYSQFHNKSVLSEFFCKHIPCKDKNRVLQLLVKHFDDPKLFQLIEGELLVSAYPNLTEEEEDDQEIMHLMSGVKLNPNMKKEAGEQFMRNSMKNKHADNGEAKEIKNIIDGVESSMFVIKVNTTKSNKEKFEIKINQSKYEKSEFELYFQSYCEQFKFFKKAIKAFLNYYKNGFSGILSAYFLTLIGTLRRLQLINDLKDRNNIFSLEIDTKKIDYRPYIDLLKKQLIGEAKLFVNLKNMIENSDMPIKTYQILSPYIEDAIETIDKAQTENFTFFFFTALIKKRQPKNYCSVFMIECMHILLHKNYQIVFFENDFPKEWDESYFNSRVLLIESLLPSWSL